MRLIRNKPWFGVQQSCSAATWATDPDRVHGLHRIRMSNMAAFPKTTRILIRRLSLKALHYKCCAEVSTASVLPALFIDIIRTLLQQGFCDLDRSQNVRRAQPGPYGRCCVFVWGWKCRERRLFGRKGPTSAYSPDRPFLGFLSFFRTILYDNRSSGADTHRQVGTRNVHVFIEQ